VSSFYFYVVVMVLAIEGFEQTTHTHRERKRGREGACESRD
jgi:hypothetical protein